MKKKVVIQFFKFCTVGFIATITNIILLYFFTEFLKIYYIISAIFGWILSGIGNYLLNKTWTFNEKIKEHPIIKYVQFSIVSIVALLLNLSLLYFLTEFFHIYYILSQIIAISIALWINFLGNKFWTFKN